MKRHVLAENMIRFRTKNLTELYNESNLPDFSYILMNVLEQKYPGIQFNRTLDGVESEDGQLTVIADSIIEDGYGGVWVWDVNVGPYEGVMTAAIRQTTELILKQHPNLKPAIFVDGENQNPRAWEAIAKKLGYKIIE